MSKVLNLTFASSLNNFCEVNSSFDSAILRIAYPGQNRNGSCISKETFEKCINTIYNCPIVTNYDRETNSLGGHDMEVVSDSDGNIRLVNLTTPVGVVPESSNWFWADIEDDDGITREYLCAEVLLWKRQEAYQKIAEDGIVEQSMEISVKNGKVINKIFHIYDFEFTAFALIGCTPCYQGASLETFSKKDFKEQFVEMMQELKDSYKDIETFNKDSDKNQISMEGGKALNEKINLAKEYGIDINSLDFSIEEFSLEELKEKFEAMIPNNDKNVSEVEVVAETSNEATDSENVTLTENSDEMFELQGDITESIIRAVDSEKIQYDWGEVCRYCYVDYDTDIHRVYCWDTQDWLLYSFEYKNNGDNIEIVFDSKKRAKFAIVDFDEGEQPSPIANLFTKMSEVLTEYAEREVGYKADLEKYASAEEELITLRKFKEETEEAVAKEKRDAVFSKFEDLNGDETFEMLKEHGAEYDIETLEDKCFAIRGRKANVSAKFSLNDRPTVVNKIDKTNTGLKDEEPYGDLFIKYNVGQSK